MRGICKCSYQQCLHMDLITHLFTEVYDSNILKIFLCISLVCFLLRKLICWKYLALNYSLIFRTEYLQDVTSKNVCPVLSTYNFHLEYFSLFVRLLLLLFLLFFFGLFWFHKIAFHGLIVYCNSIDITWEARYVSFVGDIVMLGNINVFSGLDSCLKQKKQIFVTLLW